jgi:ADP-heptose:LPS heptosyltransferase
MILKIGPSPRSIGIFRPSSALELFASVPVFRALRRAYPDARLVLIAGEDGQEFVENFAPELDDFVPFPGFPGIAGPAPRPAQFPAFLARLRAEAFDLVLQLDTRSWTASALVMLFEARAYGGFTRPGGYRSPRGHYLALAPGTTESARQLALLAALGLEDLGLDGGFRDWRGDACELAALAAQVNLTHGTYVCLYADVASSEGLSVLADGLAGAGFRILLMGAAHERAELDGIVARLTVPVVNLAGRLSLRGLGEVLRESALVIAHDDGLLRFAESLGRPGVLRVPGAECTALSEALARLADLGSLASMRSAKDLAPRDSVLA